MANFVDGYSMMVAMESGAVVNPAVNKDLEAATDYLLADVMGSRSVVVTPVEYSHQNSHVHLSLARLTVGLILLTQKLDDHQYLLSWAYHLKKTRLSSHNVLIGERGLLWQG